MATTFCQDFWKYLFLCGVFYFAIMGLLVHFEFEPTRVMDKYSEVTSVACWIVAGICLILFILFSFLYRDDPVQKPRKKSLSKYEPLLEQREVTNTPNNNYS
mmetsp:Transcript_29791/g.30939  ORF Transcript_29791/g.30939 Transcript_29791/m.30939 type:complete len:102 (-) Transcript_29791:149-454(-)